MTSKTREFSAVTQLRDGMNEEVAYYDEELTELIQNIEDGVDSLHKKRQAAKAEAIRGLEDRMKRAKQVLHSLKVEMRELPREQQQQYDLKHKEHHTKLQALNGDLQIAKSEADRHNLGVRSIEEMTPGEILEVASATQDKSLASVGRMKQTIAASKQVGVETAEKLRGQTEQLKHIDEDIMKVKSNLNRADILIRAFVRKMMTDKLIMLLMCLIFAGVIGIVIYRVVKPKSSADDDESGGTWNQAVFAANQNNRLLQAAGSREWRRELSAARSPRELAHALATLLRALQENE